MEITTEQIKALRDATNVSVMQCKKALEEAGGDMEKAVMILKKKSSEVALKKSDRDASDGMIFIAQNGTTGVLLVLNCETDFVAKNSDFIELGNTLVQKALEGAEALQSASEELISPVVQKVGENIKVGNVHYVTGATIGTYVHNGKIGTIVVLEGGNETIAKDVAMQITAMKPEYIRNSDIPAETIEKATELLRKEVDETNKPADMKEKILEGKLKAFFKEQTLLDQAFFKNPDLTIAQLLEGGSATYVSHITETI